MKFLFSLFPAAFLVFFYISTASICKHSSPSNDLALTWSINNIDQHKVVSSLQHFGYLDNNNHDASPLEISFSFQGKQKATYVAELIISMLGITLDSKVVTLPVQSKQKIQGIFSHVFDKEVASLLSSHIPIHIHLSVAQKVNEHDSSLSSTCQEVTQEVYFKSGSQMLTSKRFGFEKSEIDYLFDKWYHQHKFDIFLPEDTDSHMEVDDEFVEFMQAEVELGMSSMLKARKHTFEANLVKIAHHNSKEDSWKMGMNHFGHLTAKEFKRIFASGYQRPEINSHSVHLNKINNLRSFNQMKRSLMTEFKVKEDLPKEVNWVEKGAVTPVKNQGACGSCWTFASTGALEGAYFIKYHQLVSFSEQELVSCDHVDLGCQGGAMDNAFNFITTQHGLCSEDTYPYSAGQGVRGFCNITCSPVANSAPMSVVDVDHTESSLLAALAQQPVAVAIEADEEAFQFYSSGVLTAPCSQQLDHGVLAVGYGTSEDNIDYWLVKNSWGPMWGDQGYIKLQRGVELEMGGECGILLGPSYPVL